MVRGERSEADTHNRREKTNVGKRKGKSVWAPRWNWLSSLNTFKKERKCMHLVSFHGTRVGHGPVVENHWYIPFLVLSNQSVVFFGHKKQWLKKKKKHVKSVVCRCYSSAQTIYRYKFNVLSQQQGDARTASHSDLVQRNISKKKKQNKREQHPSSTQKRQS